MLLFDSLTFLKTQALDSVLLLLTISGSNFRFIRFDQKWTLDFPASFWTDYIHLQLTPSLGLQMEWHTSLSQSTFSDGKPKPRLKTFQVFSNMNIASLWLISRGPHMYQSHTHIDVDRLDGVDMDIGSGGRTVPLAKLVAVVLLVRPEAGWDGYGLGRGHSSVAYRPGDRKSVSG